MLKPDKWSLNYDGRIKILFDRQDLKSFASQSLQAQETTAGYVPSKGEKKLKKM